MGARLPELTEGPASCKVWEIKTLGRTDDARAREMLEKTAWQVQPIMRKRGWKVAELCEMKPEQRDRVGDNLNMGQRVRLKLRRNNKGDWFDYEHVVLVMLHELVHNDIGPHNAKFFKLITRHEKAHAAISMSPPQQPAASCLHRSLFASLREALHASRQ